MVANNKEVDVFELYRRVLSFGRRWWWLLCFFIFIGSAFGFIKEKINGTSYQSSVVVSSDLLTKDELYRLIYPVISEDDKLDAKVYADYFHCDESVFQEVYSFNIDTSVFYQSIVINCFQKDSSKIGVMSQVLSDFYNKQKDIRVRYNNEIESVRRYLKLIEEELVDINNFQSRVLDSSVGSELVVMNLAGSSEEIIRLYNKQLEMERRLLMDKPVNVDFSGVFIVNNPKYIKAIVLWAFIAGFLGFMLSLFLELDRVARRGNK